MAESTMSLAYTEISTEVASFLGYGRTGANWTTGQTTDIHAAMDAGYRKFLNAHPWTFLKATSTLFTWPDVSGTASGVASYDGAEYSTLTATSSVFNSGMVYHSLTYATSGNAYAISSVTSGTVIVLEGDSSGEASGDAISIDSGAVYNLPDDFASMADRAFYFPSDTGRRPIPVTSEALIHSLDAGVAVNTYPEWAAIRWRTKPAGSSIGQRAEVLFYPEPEAERTLTYRYNVLPHTIRSSTQYPLGGAVHGETILAACIAAAELQRDDDRGPRHQEFIELLQLSVERDKKNVPDTLGYNSDNSDNTSPWMVERTTYVNVNGVRPS